MSFISLESVTLADGPQVTGFQRLRTADTTTLFDSQQEYGLDTLRLWDVTANGTLPTALNTNGSVTDGAGNSVGPRDANTGMTPIVVSSTNNHYSVLQSRQYTRYVPGYSHLIYITGIFATGASASASFVLRTSTSGSVVDTAVAQANWSEDKFDGAGPSGITLDLTKIQILVIDAQMLYAGRIRTYFDINGRLYPAHFFEVANNQSMATVQTFNLPVRLEARTSGSNTLARVGYFDSANGVFLQTSRAVAGGTIHFECCSVQSEGPGESRGFPQCAGTSPTARISVTTRRPLITVRPRLTYNGKTNRSHFELTEYSLSATTNNAFYEIVIGGTLTGANFTAVGTSVTAGSFVTGVRYVITTVGTTNFTLIGAASNTVGLEFTATGAGTGTGTAVTNISAAEVDTSATTISGGRTVLCGRILSALGSGGGSLQSEVDPRGPITLSQIDALTATQYGLSIVATSEAGTSNLTADLHWHEQVV